MREAKGSRGDPRALESLDHSCALGRDEDHFHCICACGHRWVEGCAVVAKVIANGTPPSFKFGDRRLVPVDAVKELLAQAYARAASM